MLKKTIPVLFKYIKSLAPALVVFICASWPVARANNTLLLDKVIATVNQELILHSDLEEACRQLALEGKVINASVKMHLLRELVLNKIFLSKAMLHDVKIPKAHIQRACDGRIAALIRQLGSEEKLAQVAHQSIYDIKKGLKQRFKAEYLASWVYQYLTQDVVVRPAEVKAYFNGLPPNDRPYYPAAVQVHQLVIYPKVASARQEAVKSKLLHLKQLLLDGEGTFAELAKQHSEDPHSAAKGGEIGWVSLGILTPTYESTALSLKLGEVSDPIASEYGFHLIELIGRNKDQYNTRHILQTVKPTEEEIRLTEVELNAIKAKIIAGTLTFEAAVQQYSEDKETVAQGGLIANNQQGGDLLPGRCMPVEALDPEVYFAIDGLEEGAVSKPQYMRTPYGPAWRLLYLKQKIEAHPMNLVQDYEKLYHDLLQQKKKEAVDKWIQTAKSQCVISFAPEYRAVEQLL
ncbi:peptidylprolyl isomerase [Cardinium endosymbiont of Philonthus spinipes]|uniref:peptidylprolyl isomerase n=1 Tax=Cardinium endosymbiont of Philonthus spinipes TaxID=3077941 RepID=UPI00313D5C93